MRKSTSKPVVVIPNLNGGEALLAAIESLEKQTLKPHIIVVDNASTDGSGQKAQAKHPEVELIWHKRNKGYAGGVNPGFKRAIELETAYAAPFNDDAVADMYWLEKLVTFLDKNPSYGSASCKVLKDDGKHIDSTGDFLTVWGLPYPRGRDEVDEGQYDSETEIFAASGAASLYRVETLKQIGLLDEAFFAYYEDVDLGFRMQNQGWKVGFVPDAKVYHAIGMTSGRMKGFTTYQTLKNLPWVLWKNVPFGLLPIILPRFTVAYISFVLSAVARKQFLPVLKGLFVSLVLLPKKLIQRRVIQRKRKVPTDYIHSIITWDLPPNATKLRKLRAAWWSFIRRR